MSGIGQIAKLLLPQVPTLANAALWHSLGQSENSKVWDLRTVLTIHVLRYMMNGAGRSKPSPIGRVQAMSINDPGVKGQTWVAKATITAPTESEEGLREAVFQAIDDMKVGPLNYTKPDLVDIEVEWTGYRPEAGKEEPLPAISEEEKYKKLMAEPSKTSETTILYVHGGAYYLADPATHRPLCSKLAKASKGRVCSVRYRLAPQGAFPAQLLDAFMVYLSLLYPPPGSMHEAVPAKNLVIGGDSAGGNLAFALLQLLLQLHRTSPNPTVRFYGKDVAVPLPAAVTANSGWFDISRTLPSVIDNSKYDYLPPPNPDDAVSRFAHDNVWPTRPPRGDMFCDLSLLDHPLVSVVAADSWAGSPPLWMNTGEEMLTVEDQVVASLAAQQGVTVEYEEYQAMPHCFPMILSHLPSANRCIKAWGDFCRRAVEEPKTLKTKGTYIYVKTGKEEPLQVQSRSKIELAEVKSRLSEAKERRFKGYDAEGKMMPKPAL